MLRILIKIFYSKIYLIQGVYIYIKRPSFLHILSLSGENEINSSGGYYDYNKINNTQDSKSVEQENIAVNLKGLNSFYFPFLEIMELLSTSALTSLSNKNWVILFPTDFLNEKIVLECFKCISQKLTQLISKEAVNFYSYIVLWEHVKNSTEIRLSFVVYMECSKLCSARSLLKKFFSSCFKNKEYLDFSNIKIIPRPVKVTSSMIVKGFINRSKTSYAVGVFASGIPKVCGLNLKRLKENNNLLKHHCLFLQDCKFDDTNFFSNFSNFSEFISKTSGFSGNFFKERNFGNEFTNITNSFNFKDSYISQKSKYRMQLIQVSRQSLIFMEAACKENFGLLRFKVIACYKGSLKAQSFELFLGIFDRDFSPEGAIIKRLHKTMPYLKKLFYLIGFYKTSLNRLDSLKLSPCIEEVYDYTIGLVKRLFPTLCLDNFLIFQNSRAFHRGIARNFLSEFNMLLVSNGLSKL